jgi:hypothetical protein
MLPRARRGRREEERGTLDERERAVAEREAKLVTTAKAVAEAEAAVLAEEQALRATQTPAERRDEEYTRKKRIVEQEEEEARYENDYGVTTCDMVPTRGAYGEVEWIDRRRYNGIELERELAERRRALMKEYGRTAW